MHLGYWTVFSDEQAILACRDFQSAWTLVYDLSQHMRRQNESTTQTRE